MEETPRFDYGETVRVLRNIRNDGTYPGEPTGTMLIRRGSVGYVKDVGTFLQDQVVYSVHFLDDEKMVGCRQEELQSADLPWTPNQFEFGDKVAPNIPLGMNGEIIAEEGAPGEIIKVLRDHPDGMAYHVRFPGRTLMVPETALSPLEDYPLEEELPQP